jgi:hypothetical protein
MKKPLLVSLALLAIVSLGFGCGGRQGKAKATIAAINNAPATLESVSAGKTPGGKPVRVYKVVLQAPHGEHLLLVVGDEKVPVTLSSASVVKIGETALLSCPYLSMGNGVVFAAKTSGSTVLAMLEQADLGGPLVPEPTSSSAPVPKGFPLDAFKSKLMSGTTIQISKLDAL